QSANHDQQGDERHPQDGDHLGHAAALQRQHQRREDERQQDRQGDRNEDAPRHPEGRDDENDPTDHVERWPGRDDGLSVGHRVNPPKNRPQAQRRPARRGRGGHSPSGPRAFQGPVSLRLTWRQDVGHTAGTSAAMLIRPSRQATAGGAKGGVRGPNSSAYQRSRNGWELTEPRTRATMSSTRKMMKSSRAASIATPTARPKPNTAHTKAITRKSNARRSMMSSLPRYRF